MKTLGKAKSKGQWRVVARDPSGKIVATTEWQNIVVNEGLDYLLDAGLAGGSQETTWYVGLTDGTPTIAAGDTMSSHAGWTEVTAYTESVRQTWTPDSNGVQSQSIDNVSNPAQFSINADSTTVGGAFLSSNSTKSGTTGLLYAAGAFSGGDVTLSNGSTLDVQATFTEAAA